MTKIDKKVAVVTVGYNGQDYTETCVKSLLEDNELPIEIIAVNNGSTDDTLTILNSLKEQHANFHVLSLSENKGFSGGYNVGMKYALDNIDCDYVMIINNDTYVPKGTIRRLKDSFGLLESQGYKQVGAIGPVTNYISGRQCIQVPKLHAFDDIQNLADTIAKSNAGKCVETGHLIGFAIMFTREALETVGLFDPQFFPGNWEDSDHQVRMRRAGYLSFFAEDTFIYHYGSKTCQAVEKESKHNAFYENKERFVKKWTKENNVGIAKRVVGVCRVKNGELYLNDTLEAVSRMCESLVVFDDHSTDKTEQICKQHPKVLYIKSPFDTFDEARDRNYILNEAKKLGAEWIWIFDADEVPEEALIENIQSLVNTADPFQKLFIFKIDNFWDNPRMIRVDGLWGGFYQGRLYKVEPNQEIRSRGDDNLHCGSHPFFPQENIVMTKFRIKHYGNMDPDVRKNKYEWYTKTDVSKDIGCVLGGFSNYYKKLYGYNENEELKDEDYYRHIVDETGIKIIPWIERPTISLCIIAKNEEKHIERLLESSKLVADEIVVTIDSESTDKTEEICRRYTDKIYKWVWNESGFSGMRNFCISKASGRNILMLDGDEVIPKGTSKHILEAVQDDTVLAYLCSFKNWQDGDIEGKSTWELSETFRLFKNVPYLYFSGLVHEDLSESLEKASAYTKVVIGQLNAPFYNYGYLKGEECVKRKHKFYSELLKKQIDKNPSDYRALLNYASDLSHSDQYDEAEVYFKKALEINPNLWAAHNGLGVIYYRKAMNQDLLHKAQLEFQKALAATAITPLIDQSRINRVKSNFKSILDIRKSVN